MSTLYGEYYDAIINWPKRLAREMPLLEELARKAGPRVLVPGCGPGGHVVALAQRGFQVLGFDADEGALEVTRRRIESARDSIQVAAGEARVQLLRMEDAAQLGPVYDIAFGLGNALPSLSADGQLLAALKGIAGALRPGGYYFTQNLNYDLRWREKSPWLPLLSGETATEEVLMVKFAAYDAQGIDFHAMYITREKPAGKWKTQVRTTRQIPLFKKRLVDVLTEAEFVNFLFWGDYQKSDFDPAKSNDLLVLAQKHAGK